MDVKKLQANETHFKVERKPFGTKAVTEFLRLDESTIIKEIGCVFKEKILYNYTAVQGGEVHSKKTANGEVAVASNHKKVADGKSYSVTLSFEMEDVEQLMGFGQAEDGILDFYNKEEYIYQNNMRIGLPVMISSSHYAIFIDTESAMKFTCKDKILTFEIDTADEVSYYIIAADSMDLIVRSIREITGRASMLPRWSYGYIQSKEKYNSAAELVNVVEEFREREIPIDCIVQDWMSWDEGLWGEKIPDQTRFPSVSNLTNTLHNLDTRLMISIWPNMATDSNNYKAFESKGYLLPNSNIYDAYDEEARKLYWEQCNEHWFAGGVDAWWCDNAEPFSDPDWSGPIKRDKETRYDIVIEASKKSIDPRRINAFGLYHAKCISDNWRKTNSSKRVVNLTRSTYMGAQKYGTIPWSGDITAKWSTLKNQIVEGLKMGLCGMPHWTLDIGGFFTVHEKWQNRGCGCNELTDPLWFWNGDYEEGVNDPGYRELYTRWLQLGVFLPVFRSHGTDTPREPWRFGEKGTQFYDIIVSYIKLRYKLLPYIYSLGYDVYREHKTMMRSLMFDFSEDRETWKITDQFMFGEAFLVAPVTNPMYYDKGNQILEDIPYTRNVYLPKGCDWYDYWTNEHYTGGQWIVADAPMDKIPLFVKAGSMIPMSKEMTHADENDGSVDKLYIYAGASSRYSLYNDSGDGYGYEKGQFAQMELYYDDMDKTILVSDKNGDLEHQNSFDVVLINQGGQQIEMKLD